MFDGLLERIGRRVSSLKEPTAERYLPYRSHVRPNIVALDGGVLLAMFRLDGSNMELDTDDEISARVISLNEHFKALADPRRSLTLHVVKSPADAADYPEARCRSAFAQQFDDAYQASLFRAEKPLLRLDIYLSLLLLPQAMVDASARTRLAPKRRKKEKGEKADPIAERIRAMEEFATQAAASLAGFVPVRLGKRDDGYRTFSEIAEALHHVLYNERIPIGMPHGPLAHAIYSDPIILHYSGTGELRMDGGPVYLATFGPRVPSTTVWPTMFRKVLTGDYRSCTTHTFSYWPMHVGHARMSMRRRQLMTANDPAKSQARLLKLFADKLYNGEFATGDNHFSVTVYASAGPADNPLDPVNKAAATLRTDLASAGISATRENIGLIAAFYSQMPGNLHLRTRPGQSTTLNLAAMAPLDAPPTGAARGHWGDPVLMLRTRAGSPYRFHLHAPRALGEDGDLGNTLIVGPSGSGKTVLLGATVLMAERLNAQVVLFDKDRGLEILTRALGGVYMPMRVEDMGTAPLRALTSSPDDVAFLANWITSLVRQSGGPRPTPLEEHALVLGLRTLMALPPEQRGMGELRAFLGVSGQDGLGAHFQRWCQGGALGWAFDAAEDRIGLDAPLIGFDMTKVLDHPQVSGPAMAYLFQRIESLMDGRRLLLVVDEFWKALLDPLFAPLVNDKLKTIRKKNGAVILATQSIRDVLRSPIAHTIMEQTPTKAWMANPRAVWEDHHEAGMTDARYRAIKHGAVKDRAFLVEQQESAVMATLPLDQVRSLVNVISGRDETLALLDQLRATHGDEPAAWLPHFIAQAPAAIAQAKNRNR